MNRMTARRVPVCLLGPGRVGRAFLAQLVDRREPLRSRHGLRLCVVAVADRSGLVAAVRDEIDDVSLLAVIDHKTRGRRLTAYDGAKAGSGATTVEVLDPSIADTFGETPILVDASAADTTLSLLDASDAGWRLALANKLPLTGPQALYDRLTRAGVGARWETTVASALPVVATLQRLRDQGDEIRWITGALSGTLGHVTKRVTTDQRLSAAVEEAVLDGLSEPDPRADLSGSDVARKALILARVAGMELELDDVSVESLYPSGWDTLDLDTFFQRLPALDKPIAAKIRKARDQGATVRYAATIGDQTATAGWITLDEASPLARIDSADSAVVFETSRFRDRPLVVSGRGGGPDTTAAGLMADVIDLACP